MGVTTARPATAVRSVTSNGHSIPILPTQPTRGPLPLCPVNAVSRWASCTTAPPSAFSLGTPGSAYFTTSAFSPVRCPTPGVAKFLLPKSVTKPLPAACKIDGYDHQTTRDSLGNVGSISILHLPQLRVSDRKRQARARCVAGRQEHRPGF